MSKPKSELLSLRSIGPAGVEDLNKLGITKIQDLVGKDGLDLYDNLCSITGARHDPCVIDVFRCAIAQAENPNLPDEQKNWWYWSKIRKSS